MLQREPHAPRRASRRAASAAALLLALALGGTPVGAEEAGSAPQGASSGGSSPASAAPVSSPEGARTEGPGRPAEEAAAPPPVASRPPASWTPARSPDRQVRELWARGQELERDDELLAAIEAYRPIAREHHPDRAHPYWRIARNYWRYAEALPRDAEERRLEYFEKASAWAQRGLEVDPQCGECCLYQFSSESRIATLRGMTSLVPKLDDLDRLLQRCMELPIDHADNEWNVEQANLYYAASSFYRLVPDSFWMEMVSGARGDRERAVELMRRANAIVDDRVDYHVGLGAALLCLAEERDRPELRREGMQVLAEVDELPTRLPTDPLDRRLAKGLRADPDEACGHTRSGHVDPDDVPEDAG